ncbi:cell division protein FtsK [Haloechinothrix sp. LS1_15]|nr:cell division protein FtsK [Haloechinothrix sp. LS1_15]
MVASGRPPHPPGTEPSGAVEHVGPVYDAELIDDIPPNGQHQQHPSRWCRWWQWLAARWRGSPRVPLWLKDRTQLTQAAKDALAAVLTSPVRFAGAVVRGTVTAGRVWRRWVSVADYRQAAEEAGKLADKYTDIRALALFRWKVTGAALAVAALAVTWSVLLSDDRLLWLVGGALAVVLAVFGRRRDGQPGRRQALAGPRSLTWTMDPHILVDAFRDARLIGKDETLRLVDRPTRQGHGWAVTLDLPATRKAVDVLKHRDALASALAVDEVQLVVERVRGTGGHAGRVALWVADTDPYDTPPKRTPLRDAERWDAWQPVPFGRDARDRPVVLPLVWTSLLIGAIPRQGKTFAARLAASGLILDPHARLYVADFKAGKDWDAAQAVAYRFLSGDDHHHVLALRDWLAELVEHVQSRYRRMRQLDDATCPESKITPAMSRDPALDMPITALVIDEVQVPLEDRTPVTVDGQRLPTGERIGELLTWLAKKAPAAGVVLILATQRPDSRTIPSGLRAVLGSRFALRVMDWRDSNIILGEQMNTRGHDASRLLAAHKGVGILRPDGDTTSGEEVATTVRTYYVPGDDWNALCQHGHTLREAEGTLTGHAAGHHHTPRLDHAPSVAALASGHGSSGGHEADNVPEPLASVAAYLADDLDSEHGREFVPTAELLDALDTDATTFARGMHDLGCQPVRRRIVDQDGTSRQVRGYRTADIHAALDHHGGGKDDG